MSFFAAGSWCKFKKRHAKTEYHNKRLVLLVLMGLYHLSLSREILLSLWIWYVPCNLTTPCCYLAVAIFTSIWESYIQNLKRKKGVWGTNLLSNFFLWKYRMEIYQQSFRCNKTIYFSKKCPFQIFFWKWSSDMCCCIF